MNKLDESGKAHLRAEGLIGTVPIECDERCRRGFPTPIKEWKVQNQ